MNEIQIFCNLFSNCSDYFGHLFKNYLCNKHTTDVYVLRSYLLRMKKLREKIIRKRNYSIVINYINNSHFHTPIGRYKTIRHYGSGAKTLCVELNIILSSDFFVGFRGHSYTAARSVRIIRVLYDVKSTACELSQQKR